MRRARIGSSTRGRPFGPPRRGVSLVILLLGSLSSARALAAPDVTVEAKAQAKDLDASAIKLAKSGAVREAVAALQKSEALYPRPQTLKKIAELERENKDFAAAYRALGAVLSEFDGSLKPFERKAITASLAELAAITGLSHLTEHAARAKADIDGVPIGEGPLDTSVRVNLGAHTVHVVRADSFPFEGKVDVAGGAQAEVTAVLLPKPGTLAVRVKGPPGHTSVSTPPTSASRRSRKSSPRGTTSSRSAKAPRA